MKNFLLLLTVLFLLGNKTYSQTTAQNWTKTDCDGKTWNLFSALDKGGILLLQFDMMNCVYCTTAAYNTDQINKDYKTSNPGKLQMISLGYTNSTVCADMQNWKATNGFTFPCIEKCPAELAYYGSMGMPTIVIVGNKTHKVYYFKLGFTTADNAAMRTAINTALAETTNGIPEVNGNLNAVSVYPNPSRLTESVIYNLITNKTGKIEITNSLGDMVQTIYH